MVEVLIPITLFITTGFVLYVYFTNRNKERLQLIEKGLSSEIFSKKKSKNNPVLILGVISMCIGLGSFIGYFLENLGLNSEVVYPGSIFLFSGIGLISVFFLNRRLKEND